VNILEDQRRLNAGTESMSAHVVVLDSTLRRATVKTEPGTYISDILEKGCEKLGLKADKYVLK